MLLPWTNANYLDVKDYFYGKVGAIVPDKPQAGQTAVVIETGSEAAQNDSKVPAIVLVYSDKVLAQFCKVGETHYFEGRIRRLTPEDESLTSSKPAMILIEGTFPFPSPGAAFNPSRPLLRSPVKSPVGTVKLAETAKEAVANIETVKTKYAGKAQIFEGYVKELIKSGGNYVITFDTLEPQGRENVVLAVRVDASNEKALRGFKRGYLLRFDGSLVGTTTETKRRAKPGTTETEEYLSTLLTFQASKLYLRETPL